MKVRAYIVAALLFLSGCASVPWQSRTLSDGQAVGRILDDESAKLAAGTLQPIDFVPALQDNSVLFVDDDGLRLTVRDVAIGILDGAGVEALSCGWSPVFICGCQVNGEWHRFHVPLLTDQGFAQAIEAIQQTPAGQSVETTPRP